MKRLCALFLIVCLLTAACACGGKSDQAESKSDDTRGSLAFYSTDISVGEPTNLTPVDPSAEKEKKHPFTLLVYMIGADLESKTAAASQDIEEMIGCDIDSDKVNLLIYTGGCELWHNGIPADANYLYRYDSAEAGLVKVAVTDGLYNMGSAQTLTDVLNYMNLYYPSDRCGLVFWDHGNGSVLGYGSDQLFGNDGLNPQELSVALDSSDFGNDKRFAFIGFDACLMCSLETAIAVTPYADYLIASEETEPGAGWDYSVFSGFGGDEASLDIAKDIIDSYAAAGDFYREQSYAHSSPDLTLSCCDLSKTEAVLSSLDAFCENLGDMGTIYPTVSKIRNRTKEFAAGYGLDQIDLCHFAQLAAIRWPDASNALADAVKEMVVYQTANVPDANGLSFYFPYFGSELYENKGTDSLTSLYEGNHFGDFISSFLAAKENGQEDSHGLKESSVRDDVLVLNLTEEEKTTMASVSYSLYTKTPDEGYVPFLVDMPVEPDSSGEYCIPTAPKGIFLEDAAGSKLNCPAKVVENRADGLCLVIEMQAVNDMVFMPYVSFQNCEVRLIVPEGSETATIQSILQTDEGTFGDRKELDLEDYSYFKVNYSRSYQVTKNKKGEVLPFREWKFESGASWFNYCPIGSDFRFVYDKPDAMEEGDCVIQITVRDIFGNEFSSDLIEPDLNSEYVFAEQVVPDGKLKFAVYEDHAELMSLEGEIRDLVVPDHAEGKPVTRIGYSYYHDNQVISDCNPYLETLVLPDTATMIADRAFFNCTSLREVKLPSSLVSIGAMAFADTAIESIDLPDTLERIGQSAFHYCVKTYYDDNFQSTQRGLTKVELPSGIREIGEGAFCGCPMLERIEIDGSDRFRSVDGVLYTADGATLLCYPSGKTAKSFITPDTLSRIGISAFSSSKLESITIGEGVTHIGDHAFYCCNSLVEYNLPDSVETIGAYAFYRSQVAVDPETFQPIPSVERFYIGASVKKIGEAAFLGSRVKEFSVSESNKSFSVKENMLTDKSGTALLCVDSGDITVLHIPDGIVTVAKGAISGCISLEELYLPDSVLSLQYQNYLRLKKIHLGAGLKNVVAWPFKKAEIDLSPQNPHLELKDGKLYAKDGEPLSDR